MLRKRWKDSFPELTTKGEIKLLHLESRMATLVNGGEEFKRLFVVYVSSYFLALDPTWNVDLKLVGAVEDVSSIRKFD